MHVSVSQRLQGSFDAFVAGLTIEQLGVFSLAQAQAWGRPNGLIQRRVASGRIEEVARCVYRVAGHPASWAQSMMIACLAWGDASVVSHRAGARLLRIPAVEPAPVELTIPRGRGRRSGPGIVHHSDLLPRDVTTVGPFRVTRAERTVIDLAAVCAPDLVERAFEDTMRRGLTTVRRFEWYLRHLGRRAGVSVVRALVEECDPRTSVSLNEFEARIARGLRRAGLPIPVPQHEVHDGDRFVARIDLAYPDRKLAIEADSVRWHTGRVKFERDRERWNALTLLGWRIIHVTWPDLQTRPEGVVAKVRAALELRPAADWAGRRGREVESPGQP